MERLFSLVRITDVTRRYKTRHIIFVLPGAVLPGNQYRKPAEWKRPTLKQELVYGLHCVLTLAPAIKELYCLGAH